ncbi:Lin0368 family putative glycerol transporter subunit [Clostridium saccharoperbutylacetonicum]|jgi:hypothetical protein|uniref:Lin0368 family putative glycerol transporter subunit n=1 Tax=Clostridium saccharoperbutylacetonicum TaxID=36745 RepID=UPI0009840319|nr:hypothetical protein [Clostridium saccharoperbutylacetonicum]AQR94116.1 hypothetical protein CLSAP_14230 [Clostridium saccharoperbutylacetonicum]NSB29815.1 hypothetical protein [Clostridium saccharoperbutylacetonicum]
MSGQAIITTIIGAFIFPIFIRLFWGRLVNKFGAIGGFLSAIIIVGTIWVMNHGIEKHLIQQSGSTWIDMAWAAAIGVFTASVVAGGKIKKSLPNIGSAIVGGICGGIVLVLMF